MEPSDHLFRREAGRMVATLTRVFGVHNLALAEDAVQDAFCRALEVWKFRGVPDNPSAWLLATAKNRAFDVLRRQRTARTFAPELGRLLDSEWTFVPAVEELFTANAIKDDLLRMMFSCCQPRLAEEAQVALILNILCGFSVNEIASAFVSSHAAIEKRITRAKKLLAASKWLFDECGCVLCGCVSLHPYFIAAVAGR
jgi:RNA polymerase sigma-70 factor (ECF subfamily)